MSSINAFIKEMPSISLAPFTMCEYEKEFATKKRALNLPFRHPDL